MRGWAHESQFRYAVSAAISSIKLTFSWLALLLRDKA